MKLTPYQALLRAYYRSIGFVPTFRITGWRGTLRPWMAPGSDQTTPPDEGA